MIGPGTNPRPRPQRPSEEALGLREVTLEQRSRFGYHAKLQRGPFMMNFFAWGPGAKQRALAKAEREVERARKQAERRKASREIHTL